MDWDLSAYFPTFEHPSRQEFEQRLVDDLKQALEQSKMLPTLDTPSQGEWEAFVLSFEQLGARFSHFSSYVHTLVSADGHNPAFQDAEARLSSLEAGFTKLESQLIRGLGEASKTAFEAFLQRPALEKAGYELTRLRTQALARMAPELEELAADLGTDGISAWGRLYDGLMSNLTFEQKAPNKAPEVLPFSGRRSLMEGEDRSVRRAAFVGGNQALQPWLPTLAKALNHIAGTRLTLYRRRGVNHVLDASTFEAGITRKTLDALFEAVERQIELPREVLALKAKRQGQDTVAWYDIGSMLPVAPSPELSWDDAVSKVRTAFGRQYPALAGFFDSAIEKRWVDHQSRPGKRPGAFCTTSELIGESRVFMTYGGTLSDVSTLAHEMGHAFHGHVLRDTRLLASRYPMTLAESASIFAELVLMNGLLDDPTLPPEQQTSLLAAMVNDAPIFLLDVNTRFQFERAFYEERARGEVRPERLSELMSETQQRVFGPLLNPAETDPYFWASKLHFFITEISFYNYPYIFGYLLSRGLYAQFEQEGRAFLPRYEQFLTRSGSEEPAALARSVLGCDLEQPDFWEQSILSLRQPLEQLKSRLS